MRQTAAILAWGLALATACGCQWVHKSRLTSVEAQNRSLVEQTKAQLAEIANLKAHARTVEDELAQASSRPPVAELAPRSAARTETPQSPTPEVDTRLALLARSYPDEIAHDPRTGVARFDAPLPFAAGRSELAFETRQALVDLARLLRSPEGDQLRLVIVGHAYGAQATDGNAPSSAEDWRIGTSRALAIAEFLGRAGVPRDRLGILGYGGEPTFAPHQAIAEGTKPRQAELYLVEQDTPVVGWFSPSQRVLR